MIIKSLRYWFFFVILLFVSSFLLEEEQRTEWNISSIMFFIWPHCAAVEHSWAGRSRGSWVIVFEVKAHYLLYFLLWAFWPLGWLWKLILSGLCWAEDTFMIYIQTISKPITLYHIKVLSKFWNKASLWCLIITRRTEKNWKRLKYANKAWNWDLLW